MIANMRTATRLNSMGARPDLVGASKLSVEDMIERAATVEGLDAIDLNFPEHVQPDTANALKASIDRVGLTTTTLNLRYSSVPYAAGAFTNPDKATRREAIALTKRAVDTARELAASQVILWMAYDGVDYPFQSDFSQLWEMELEGIRDVARYADGLLVSLEYKPRDARCFPVLASGMGSLLAAADLRMLNVGITIDFCHALMAGENPAHVASLALSRNQLFGVHLNDGYGLSDDGLLVGSVHPTETLELIHVLLSGGYTGTIYFDTFPVREDPVGECAANINALRMFAERAQSLNQDVVRAVQAGQDGLQAQALSTHALISRKTTTAESAI